MSKLCQSFASYWDVEEKYRKLNPYEPTFFDGELNNWQSLKIAMIITTIAIAIISCWSIFGRII